MHLFIFLNPYLYILTLSFSFLALNPASAYLDPASSNALIYSGVAIAGAVLYGLRCLYYGVKRLTGRNIPRAEEHLHGIVILSEGRSYWTSFESIVNALIKRNQPFAYLTMDVGDPGLMIDSPLATVRYIGMGDVAYHYIENLECKVLLSTTPNIGTHGYPIRKPKNVDRLVFVHHSGGSVLYYMKHSLDCYDAVCCMGEDDRHLIHLLEEKRSTPKKQLVITGLPLWDAMIAHKYDDVQQLTFTFQEKLPVILIAPSWGDKSFMKYYEPSFIKDLSRRFNIVFRPHPQTKKSKSEAKLLAHWKKELKDCFNVHFDDSPSPIAAMSRSDILISDISDAKVDYVLVWRKPAIMLEIPDQNMDKYELTDLPTSAQSKAANLDIPNCYTHVRKDNIPNILSITEDALKEFDSKAAEEYITKNIANWGCAGESVASYLIESLCELSDKEK